MFPPRPVPALERIEVGAQIDAFIGEVQLVSRHAAVLFNGVKGDVEQAGNLFAGQAVFHHIADLDLAGTGDKAFEWYKKYLKIHPLETGPRESRAINMSGKGINSLAPEDGSAFRMLNEIIQYEPSELFELEQLSKLASLGIVKGKSVRSYRTPYEVFFNTKTSLTVALQS